MADTESKKEGFVVPEYPAESTMEADNAPRPDWKTYTAHQITMVTPAKVGVGDIPGETGVYRNTIWKDGLTNDIKVKGEAYPVKTLFELFEHVANKFPDKDFLGHRPKNTAPDGAVTYGPYSWLSYADTRERKRDLAAALQVLGLQANSKVGVYLLNCPEWVITEQACFHLRMLPVALYDTLGPNAVQYVIVHADCEAIVTSSNHLAPVLEMARDAPKLKAVIVVDRPVSENDKRLGKDSNVEVLEWSEAMKVGKEALTKHPELEKGTPPDASDLCTVMYTSGSTGAPKGAMLSHGNAIAMIGSVIRTPEIGATYCRGATHMSYLPLAHSFERLVAQVSMVEGGRIGFYTGTMPNLLADIGALKPSFMVGAPRVWQRIHDRLSQRIQSSPFIRRSLFNFAYWWKEGFLRSSGIDAFESKHGIMDAVVFKKTKEMLGGNVEWIVSGAAPLDPKLADFLRVVFAVPVMQGYGLTEIYAASTVAVAHDTSMGHVGVPNSCNEIKLLDASEMDYFATDKPYPRGEVLIRGPNVFAGYYKDEAKTSEIVDQDGWFHTGDIGMIQEGGQLSIIDRRKNIFKLAQGEYVAPEYIETICVRHPCIAQAFVWGSSLSSFLVAIVVPDADAILPAARLRGAISPDSDDLETVCKSEEIKGLIMEGIKQKSAEAKLKGFEVVKAISLTPELFSVENGLLTPSFKQRRAQLRVRYADTLDALMQSLSPAGAGGTAGNKIA